MNGLFNKSGGLFTSTSGTWEHTSDFFITGGGTFDANGGLILLMAAPSRLEWFPGE